MNAGPVNLPILTNPRLSNRVPQHIQVTRRTLPSKQNPLVTIQMVCTLLLDQRLSLITWERTRNSHGVRRLARLVRDGSPSLGHRLRQRGERPLYIYIYIKDGKLTPLKKDMGFNLFSWSSFFIFYMNMCRSRGGSIDKFDLSLGDYPCLAVVFWKKGKCS